MRFTFAVCFFTSLIFKKVKILKFTQSYFEIDILFNLQSYSKLIWQAFYSPADNQGETSEYKKRRIYTCLHYINNFLNVYLVT